MGSKSYDLGINDVSETRVNGKKATQPCPCGHSGDKKHDCTCSGEQIQRYAHRVSGPLLDRIDLHVEVPCPGTSVLDRSGPTPESSAAVAKRVRAAREIQLERQGCPNAQLGNKTLDQYCQLGKGEKDLLERAAERLALSPRGVHRVLKVARTLADLESEDQIGEAQLAEAIAYRSPIKNRGSG